MPMSQHAALVILLGFACPLFVAAVPAQQPSQVVSGEQPMPIRTECISVEGPWRLVSIYFRDGVRAPIGGDSVAIASFAERFAYSLGSRVWGNVPPPLLTCTGVRWGIDGALVDFDLCLTVPGGKDATVLSFHDAHLRIVTNARGFVSTVTGKVWNALTDVTMPTTALPWDELAKRLAGQAASVTQREPILRNGLVTSPHVPPGIVDGSPETRAIEARAALVPRRDRGLAIVAVEDRARVARVVECAAHSRFGRTSMEVVVDPENGVVLQSRDMSCYHGGSGEVCFQSPLVAPVPIAVPLPHLDGSGALVGDWITVRAIPGLLPAVESSLSFNYWPLQTANQYIRASQVLGYHTATEMRRSMMALGYPRIMESTLIDYDGSAAHSFDHKDLSIVINPNGGFPYGMIGADGLNGDILSHECGHKIQWDHTGYLAGTTGSVGGAAQEGFADFNAAAHYWACAGLPIVGGHLHLFEHAGSAPYTTFTRTLFNTLTALEPLVTFADPYQAGASLISAPGADMAACFGMAKMRRLYLRELEFRPAQVPALVEGLVQADYDLYLGADEAVIREQLAIRHLLGNRTISPWTPSTLPESAHPYTDDIDETRLHTVPGASSLRVVFHPSTRMYYGAFLANPANYHDLLYVQDAQGNDIAGSPFTAEQLQGETVTVPGDTVRFRLWSIAGNHRVAFGYRCLAIASSNPGNQPPVARLTASASTVMVPSVVTFHADAASDLDGTIVAYRLDPGDGSRPIHLDPRNPRAEHLYQFTGCNTVTAPVTLQATLRVTDNEGATHTTSLPIVLLPHVVSSRYEILGVGCGSPTPTIDYRRSPRVGDHFAAVARGVQANAIVVLATGFSDTMFQGQALPIDLSMVGAPGCSLRVALDMLTFSVANSAGEATVEFQVPDSRDYFGLQAFQQFAVLDANANQMGMVLSAEGRATVGDN